MPDTTGCEGILDSAYVINTKGTSAILCSVTASMNLTRNSSEKIISNYSEMSGMHQLFESSEMLCTKLVVNSTKEEEMAEQEPSAASCSLFIKMKNSFPVIFQNNSTYRV